MKVYVNYNDSRWKKYHIDFEKIANAVIGKKYADSEVSIILTNDKEIHALNKQYRNIDKPTNVLSFELGDDILLGDIYISLDTVMREASDAKISVSDHVAHMVVHGMFHLLGYDHLTDAQAKVMEGKEIVALNKLGIKNPYADEVDNKFGWWRYLACALLGGIASLGFAPFNLWWVTVLSVMGAYWLLCTGTVRVPFWTAFWRAVPYGAMYAISMFWWTLNSIYVVPELARQFAVWTVPALIGIGIFGALIFTIPFVLTSCIYIKSGAKPFLFAGVWTAVLWLREWLFTGFPWNPIANIALSYPAISNSMSVFGALGLTFIITGLIAAIVQCAVDKKKKINWFVLAFFAGLFCLGVCLGCRNIKQSQGNPNGVVVRIVQPVTSQERKILLSRADAVNQAQERVKYLTDLGGNVDGVDLVIYPETAYPFVLQKYGDVMPIASGLNKPVVIGATVYNGGAVYNSLVLSDANGDIMDVYDKSHLVPFGEYGPIKFVPAPANLTAGDGERVLRIDFANGKHLKFAPAVCYEIIFSDAVVRDDADAIINITNDTWFGNTPGTYQHLDMVRRAAIESGVPVIRANYSGVSAFVAPDGSVVSSLEVGKVGVLDGSVYGAHKTLYRLLGRDMWLVIILIIAFFGGFTAYRTDK